ncbi:MAG: hypothetical protein J0I13_00825, partial [Rhizobiales bacterium]|nr:hypothetical protein [Hyphomicrobiales bacterium]
MFFLAHSANSTPNAVLSAIAAAFLLSPISASAADLYTKAPAISDVVRPAIDGFNTKFAAFGGSLANGALYAVQGSASIPLGKQWGLQVDGTIGSFDGRALGTAAGHWFQRNPGQGLIGLYASHTYWDRLGGVHLTQAAAEGAYYGNRWTLEGIAGVEFGNSVSNIVTATSVIPQNGNIPGVLTTGVFAD